jgi:4-hydroxybenzoate polyprenyltransferase
VKTASNEKRVIAVDLDGTLILTDTLHESILTFLRYNPFMFLKLLYWLLGGRAAFKAKLAGCIDLDVVALPYNRPLIDWLTEERQKGRKIALCTAANERVAYSVANYLQIFDEVIASNSEDNLKGENKRKALQNRFGVNGYDYAGNSAVDVEVWSGAVEAIVVNASEGVLKKAARACAVTKVFAPNVMPLSQASSLLRVHQWLKNLLIFVPILTAHGLDNFQDVLTLLLAFISFSLCASAVYVTNDVFDLVSDRRHPRKCNRPFASGALSLRFGFLLAPLLVFTSFWIALSVGRDFTAVLSIYLLLTTCYTLWLKKLVLVDCLILAGLYTLRIVAGAAAINLSLSFWLLAFSLFIFLSLAFVKRFAELQTQIDAGSTVAHGRGYLVADAPLIQNLGVTAGYSAVVVFALYLDSDTVQYLYKFTGLIWLALPLILFWISWMWLSAARGRMHDDPIVFAVKDKASLSVGLLTLVFFTLASVGI